MSKQIVSQVMEMVCDSCGTAKKWEFIGIEQHPEAVQEMQEWYSVERKVVVPGVGLQQIIKHACSLQCVPGAAVKLALPPQQDEPADNIDLDSLRAGVMGGDPQAN